MELHTAFIIVAILHQIAIGYKFLAYSPQFAVSHVNFLAKISDALVEAGHDVVIVAPRVDPSISGARTKKARVIELPENEESRNLQAVQLKAIEMFWNTSIVTIMLKEGNNLFEKIAETSNATLHYPGLIEQLKSEKFDAGFSEEPAGFALFHILGIDKFALTLSFTNLEFSYDLTHMPSNPSYVPSIFSAYGDRMSFVERFLNTAMSCMLGFMMPQRIKALEPVFKSVQPDGPSLMSVIRNTSLMFLNSEPLLDYPRPTVHRVIDIGGIVIPTKIEPLNEDWSSVLNLRNKTVILSFGTFIKASTMPEQYKKTIRNTLASFPDDPSHNVSDGIENIVETQWLPQVDMLSLLKDLTREKEWTNSDDPRLSGFITHAGQGSTLEAAYAGVPMLLVPTMGDQYRNAAMIKRAGLGEIVYVSALSDGNELENGIRDLLENQSRINKCKQFSAMLKNRPFSAKEVRLHQISGHDTFISHTLPLTDECMQWRHRGLTFLTLVVPIQLQKLVRNMEFLAGYGPLRMLDHEGRNLNFIQYYLIDVILFLCLVAMIVLSLVGLCLTACCKCCWTAKQRYSALKQD